MRVALIHYWLSAHRGALITQRAGLAVAACTQAGLPDPAILHKQASHFGPKQFADGIREQLKVLLDSEHFGVSMQHLSWEKAQ